MRNLDWEQFMTDHLHQVTWADLELRNVAGKMAISCQIWGTQKEASDGHHAAFKVSTISWSEILQFLNFHTVLIEMFCF